MSKLWEGVYEGDTNEAVDRFIVSAEQLRLDSALIRLDIFESEAHVLMLAKQKQIPADEATDLVRSLEELRSGFVIDPEHGLHMSIEKAVTEKLGAEVGGKLQTGRSRNDQIITITRMFAKEAIWHTARELRQTIIGFLEYAEEHMHTIFPGFTHTQPAQPMSLGYWASGIAQALMDDLRALEQVFRYVDRCPLGSGAAFGTVWDIDRNYTADLLDFSTPTAHGLETVSGRGEETSRLLAALSHVLIHLARFAEDVVLWTSIGLIRLDESFTHGSSLMPQKQNPDVAELIRAHANKIQGMLVQALGLLTARPSGYNRDARETKGLLFDGVELTIDALQQAASLVKAVLPQKETISRFIEERHLLATDIADLLVQHRDNVSFREAHDYVGSLVQYSVKHGRPLLDLAREKELVPADFGIEGTLYQKDHVGSPSPHFVNYHIATLYKQINSAATFWSGRHPTYEKLGEEVERCLS